MMNQRNTFIGSLVTAACLGNAAHGEPLAGANQGFQAALPTQERPNAGATANAERNADARGTRRSFWSRLEVTGGTGPARAVGSFNGLAAQRSWSEPVASGAYPRPSTRNEFGIGFNNQGVVGGFIRWRAPESNSEDATVPVPQSGANSLSTYRARQSVPCCLPELAAPLSGAQGASAREAQPTVSLLARLRTQGLDLSLPDAWKINAGVRTREYTSTLSSRMAHVTVDRQWGDLHASYSFQLERPNGWSLAPSHKIGIGYALDPQSAVGLSFTSGREMAFFGSLGALNTEVRSFAVHAEHSVKKEWSLTFSAGYFDHGAMPSHRAIRFGFSRSM